MDVETAIKCCVEKFPGRWPIGYWKHGDNIILNTKLTKQAADLTAPAQFLITPNGEVHGINPIIYDLSIDTMKKIRKS